MVEFNTASFLPLLQGLSAPVLVAVGVGLHKINNALHNLDKRLAIVEYEIKSHRRICETRNEIS